MDNTLNMRREREVRWPLGLSCWTNRRGQIARVEVERVERWTHDQLVRNTTMSIEYSQDPSNGYRSFPVRLKAKTLVPAQEERYYPLATFLDGDNSRPHTPSERVSVAINLYHSLSEKAKAYDLQSWHLLPAEHLPPSWRAVQNPRVFAHSDTKDSNPFSLTPRAKERTSSPGKHKSEPGHSAIHSSGDHSSPSFRAQTADTWSTPTKSPKKHTRKQANTSRIGNGGLLGTLNDYVTSSDCNTASPPGQFSSPTNSAPFRASFSCKDDEDDVFWNVHASPPKK